MSDTAESYRQELLKLPANERAERIYQDMQRILRSGPQTKDCDCGITVRHSVPCEFEDEA